MKRFAIILVVLFLLPSAANAIGAIKGEDSAGDTWGMACEKTGDGRCMQTPSGMTITIDSCDSATGWTALSNDTTGIAVDLDHVEGAYSMEFDAVDGAAGETAKGIYKAITSVNLTDYVADGGYLSYSMNVSATTDIAYCFLRLGTSSSHYNEWIIDDDDISVGWNYVRFDAFAPYTTGNTGNGITWSAVAYLVVGCEFDAETSALADLRFDNVVATRGSNSTTNMVSASLDPITSNLIAMAASLVTIDADTGAMATDLAAIEVLNTTIAGDTTAIQTSVELKNAKFDDDATAQCVAITASDVDYTLPTAGDWYCLTTSGNTAYINCGTTPAVDHTVGSFSLVIPEGSTICKRLTGPDCGVIGVTAAGFICFGHHNSAL